MPTPSTTRRRWLKTSIGAGAALWLPESLRAASAGLRMAPFRFDVTPPEGHPLCGGWITPVKTVADPLEAIGFVLLGAGDPIVICCVDWTGILNRAHVEWRKALAKAAGTTPERVAVQCVHQHDALLACVDSESLLEMQHAGLTCVDPVFFQSCLERGQNAVREALAKARPVTRVATGEARVDRVASNRRMERGPDGRVLRMRGSACKVPEQIALPEGLVDPMLKTVAFYNGDEKIVACHYYATHPMSHYGQGNVSSDFCGLARKQRQKEDPGCTHVYFTGCAGNIAAGKYNVGTPEARVALTERMHRAMEESEKHLAPKSIGHASWHTHEIVPEVNPVFNETDQMAMLTNPKNVPANRIRPAMRVTWIKRIQARMPLVLSALHLDDVTLMHLPSECFVEYQLRAQSFAPTRFLATAAYGDGGPWYIPIKEEYPNGGYEVSVANAADSVDGMITAGMKELLAKV
jgi:hypothetical protein